MTDQEARSTRSTTLLTIAKALVDLAAIWTVFGYLSLSAFCIHAGIPLSRDISVSRYLEEAYDVVLATALTVFGSAEFLILVFSCGVATIGLEIARRKMPTALESPLSGVPGSVILFAVTLVCAFSFAQVNSRLANSQSDVLLGKLSSNFLSDGTAGLFESTLAATSIGILLSYLFRSQAFVGDSPFSWGRRLLLLALGIFSALLTLFLPVVFGISLDRPVYIIQVQLDGTTTSSCVARILESPGALTYWRAENGIGRVEVVASSRIRTITYLRSESLLEMARTAATSREIMPRCGDNGSGAPK